MFHGTRHKPFFRDGYAPDAGLDKSGVVPVGIAEHLVHNLKDLLGAVIGQAVIDRFAFTTWNHQTFQSKP